MRIDRRREAIVLRGAHGEPYEIDFAAPFGALLLGGSWAWSLTDHVWLLAVPLALVVLASIAVHEHAHASVGRSLGMVPVRTVIHGLGGYVELADHAPSVERDRAVALAGPVINATIGAFALTLAALMPSPEPVNLTPDYAVPLFHTPPDGPLLALVTAAGWINLALAALNILPSFPLDGASVLVGVLEPRVGERRALRSTAHLGCALAVLLGVVCIWVLLFAGVFVWAPVAFAPNLRVLDANP